MPHQNIEQRLAAVLLALSALVAHAELADRNLPIHVDADSGEANEKTGLRTLAGDVQVTQGTLSLFADRATLLEQADGSQKVMGEGHPVRFRQKMEARAEWLDAHADRLEYDSHSGDVRLLGNAWLKKGGDEITGNLVTYNTTSEIYRAEGGKTAVAGSQPSEGGRVHIVIQPKQQAAQGTAKP
jgi:lipopolysaccharide export system protein LptA